MGTSYNRSQQENRNYNQAPGYYKEDPKKKVKKAIKSSATTHDPSARAMAVFIDAGDDTTWHRVDVERHDERHQRPPYGG